MEVRLETTPLLAPTPIWLGDVIEAERLPDGTLRVAGVTGGVVLCLGGDWFPGSWTDFVVVVLG